MHLQPRRFPSLSNLPTIACAFAATCLLTTAPAAAASAAPAGDRQVEVQTESGINTLAFRRDASSSPVTLRRTDGAIEEPRVVTTGIDSTVFAAWHEEGAGHWLAISTDDGGTWTSARSIRHDIPLRAGTIVPGQPLPAPAKALDQIAPSRLHIVQFHTPSLAAWRARLEELGVEVLSYLPHNAHVVRMNPETVEGVRAEPFVRWVGPYLPAFRLEPSLLAEIDEHPAHSRRYVLQTPVPGAAEKARLAQEVTAAGGRVVHQTPNGSLLEAELTGAQALVVLHSDFLQWMEVWTAAEDDMDIVREVSGANWIEGVGGYDGTGVAGEVMDSGVMDTHQDFDGILFHGGTPSNGDHGTATYGIVFGNGDRDGDGDGRATGMLPAAQGYFADYDNLVDRYLHTEELVTTIKAVFQSNSWGSGRTLHYTAVSAEMDDIIWQFDIPIFQSQSNSGDQYSRPQAWAKNIISVGGVYHYDDQDPANHCWCDGASIGPAHDGRVKPDLVFFYDDTYTTDREPGGYVSGSLYADFGGTSGATPMTAGTGGLILQMWADNIYGNAPAGNTVFEKRPHSTTLKAIMVNTAVQYPFAGVDDDKARARQGWGLPSAQQVLDRALLTRVIDESSLLEELQFDAYAAPVAPGQPELKVTLVYADRAANPAAGIHRVNDVDLRVIAPDGTEYWGNHGLDTGVWSAPGGAPNSLDTVENVFVQDPMAGDWRVEVHAREINMDVHPGTPEDDQDYALVVYGASSLDECRSPIAPPNAVSAVPSGDNQVTVSWTGTAPAFEVWRAEGGCFAPRELVATVTGNSYLDTTVPGGVIHGYLVRAVDGCPSPDSSCVQALTSGPCGLPPGFDGLEWAAAAPQPSCAVELTWSPASSRCGGSLLYNVYRSTTPGFTPDAANRVAQCMSSTSWLDDTDVWPMTRFHYVVRAEDSAATGSGPCGGVEDDNASQRAVTATTLVFTDFESGLDGWTAEIPGSSITGEFVVDDPRGTFNGNVPAQPEDAAFGQRCLFTGRNPNASIGRADVDFGEVVALSPLFDGSGFASVELSLWRWFYLRDGGEDSEDYFAIDVSNNAGVTWTNLETLDQSASGFNAWQRVHFVLEDALPLTAAMMVRVRASDGDTLGNVIEAAIDEVVIRGQLPCTADLLFADGFEDGDASRWSFTTP